MKRDCLVDVVLLGILLVLAFVILFNKLGAATVQDWDEARYGISAIEMLKSGDWVVTTYAYQPDTWNTKPPFGVWIIAINFMIFGINEFALRFGSALFCAGTVVVTYFFGRLLWNRMVGFFAALLFVASNMVLDRARSGNVDSFLVFFIIVSLYSYCLHLQNRKGHFLVISALAFGFAFLAKGYGAFAIPVIIGIDILRNGSWRQYYNKSTMFAVGGFCLVVLPWVILRLNRGVDFFRAWISSDLIGRFSQPLDGHSGGVLYHYWYINDSLGTVFFVLFNMYALYALYRYVTRGGMRWFPAVWFWVIFIVMAIAPTKMHYYMIPAFPAIGLILGGVLWDSIDSLRPHLPRWAIQSIILVVLVMIVTLRIVPAINRSTVNFQAPDAMSLKGLQKELNALDFIHDHPKSQSVYFYESSLVKQRVIFGNSPDELKPGDYLVTFDRHFVNSLLNSSKARLIASNDSAYILELV